jgi:hypothetical protein
VDVLTRLAGKRPVGYRAPAWQLSANTLALLARHGFEYSSNMMDRLSPYLHAPVDGRALVEIPVSWVLDDAPYFMFTGQRSIQAPGPVLQGWITEFDGITELGGVTNFTFHPQIIGRPSRFACLRELLDYARHTPRLWVALLHEIAPHRAAAGPFPPRASAPGARYFSRSWGATSFMMRSSVAKLSRGRRNVGMKTMLTPASAISPRRSTIWAGLPASTVSFAFSASARIRDM